LQEVALPDRKETGPSEDRLDCDQGQHCKVQGSPPEDPDEFPSTPGTNWDHDQPEHVEQHYADMKP
jgi:hypothetical protein